MGLDCSLSRSWARSWSDIVRMFCGVRGEEKQEEISREKSSRERWRVVGEV